ncbi:MAG: DEAD/DEAH box helicase [Planctomycetota bacterium]
MSEAIYPNDEYQDEEAGVPGEKAENPSSNQNRRENNTDNKRKRQRPDERSSGRSDHRSSRRRDRPSGNRGNNSRGRGDRERRDQERDSQDNRRFPLDEDELFKGRNPIHVDESDFTRFFLDENLMKGIADSGYELLTTLQEKMILPLLERENMIVQATRGSGKTAAYLIPILHTMSSRMGTRCLIITPTRDLAIQAYNEVRRLCAHMDRRSILIDPGSSINLQAKGLDDDPEIVIGTPGRILDHLRRGNFKPEELDSLVLDEVDRMLDHGQRPDLESIMKKIYACVQRIAISSTISPPVLRLCRKLVEDAVELLTAPEKPAVEAVRHSYFRVVPNFDKIELIYRLLEREEPERAIIFCRNKVGASSVTERIRTLQGGAMELHMGMAPRKQDQIIKRFRAGEFNILVTTDTFTRELDVDNISHIINFDIPEDPEDYIFRIGKTARLGVKGRAMTLVDGEDMDLLHKMESHIGSAIDEEVLPGLEPPKPEVRTQPSPVEPEKTVFHQPKPEFFHGGWHRKRPRRGRR